jgi:hypothetical protein
MKYPNLACLDENRLDNLPDEDCVEVRPFRETVAEAQAQRHSNI